MRHASTMIYSQHESAPFRCFGVWIKAYRVWSVDLQGSNEQQCFYIAADLNNFTLKNWLLIWNKKTRNWNLNLCKKS